MKTGHVGEVSNMAVRFNKMFLLATVAVREAVLKGAASYTKGFPKPSLSTNFIIMLFDLRRLL